MRLIRFVSSDRGAGVAVWAIVAAACTAAACASPAAESAGADSGLEGTTQVTDGPNGDTADSGDMGFPIYSSGSLGGAGGRQPGSGDDETSECLRLMSLGTTASSGAVPGANGLDALVDWFNRTTNAKAVHFPEPLPLSEELLGQYDVLLLQNLSNFRITPADVDVLAAWVRGGGAVVALSGFDGDGRDVTATNQLLSFSGLGFSVAAPDTALSLGDCGYCLGTSLKMAGFEPTHPISQGVTAIGSFLGRAVLGEGEAVLTEGGVQLAVAKQIEHGRVFLFHDDWVSYVPQWSGQVVVSCENNPSCSEMSPAQSYQVGQFWFNVVRWSAPDATCFESSASDIVD